MGITRECLRHYETLFTSGELDFNNCKIIEMGAQCVHFEDKELFVSFLEKFNLDKSIADTFQYNMTGRFMHESFGHNYQCVDLDDYNGDKTILTWDLNTKICPSKHKGQYDLCTNFGTTEHLFNQTNAFRLIHDLVKKDGIILHILPMKDMNHGLFNYNPVLFESLAKYNNYKILSLYMTSNHEPASFVPYTGSIPDDKTYLHCTFKKTEDAEFVNPSQIFSSGIL